MYSPNTTHTPDTLPATFGGAMEIFFGGGAKIRTLFAWW